MILLGVIVAISLALILSCSIIIPKKIANKNFDSALDKETETVSIPVTFIQPAYVVDKSIPALKIYIKAYNNDDELVAQIYPGETEYTEMDQATVYAQDKDGDYYINIVNKDRISNDHVLHDKTLVTNIEELQNLSFRCRDGEIVNYKTKNESVKTNVTKFEALRIIIESKSENERLYEIYYYLVYFSNEKIYIYEAWFFPFCNDPDLIAKIDPLCENYSS